MRTGTLGKTHEQSQPRSQMGEVAQIQTLARAMIGAPAACLPVSRAIGCLLMTALLCNPERAEALARLAHPAPLPCGCAPEERLVVGGIGWEGHLALDQEFGDDRPGPRFYYLDGDLEIMSTSDEHERISELIGGCVEDFLLEQEIPSIPRGQATMRLVEQSGAEPDKSWCLREEKQFPDVVLEIALTSGGLPKLEIYRRFAVPEVWMWRRGRLEIHSLRTDGSGYELAAASRLLPALPIQALERAVATPDWQEARRAFRRALR
jgi:Uma2 family endonuclease